MLEAPEQAAVARRQGIAVYGLRLEVATYITKTADSICRPT